MYACRTSAVKLSLLAGLLVCGALGGSPLVSQEEATSPGKELAVSWENQAWDESHFSVARVWNKVVQTPEYQQAKTQSARMTAVYDYLVRNHPYNFEKPVKKSPEARVGQA